MAPQPHIARLLAALAAFFLAVGVAAHALDELRGRPLRTRLPDRVLIRLAVCGLGGATAIGIYGAATVSLTLLPFTARRRVPRARLRPRVVRRALPHRLLVRRRVGRVSGGDRLLVNALTLRAAGVLAVAACFALSIAQRRLSSPVRELRRRTLSVSGEQCLRDGRVIPLDARRRATPLDDALAACALAVTLLAIALVVLRLR